ncbi:hypothetical protein [Crucivirus-534]|nr:hypothetical protein [Crucivirus-534]
MPRGKHAPGEYTKLYPRGNLGPESRISKKELTTPFQEISSKNLYPTVILDRGCHGHVVPHKAVTTACQAHNTTLVNRNSKQSKTCYTLQSFDNTIWLQCLEEEPNFLRRQF